MKKFRTRLILLLAISAATIVGFIKGNEAKQRWLFKIKVRNEEKRQLAQKKQLRDGGVPLDDIEIASFHKS